MDRNGQKVSADSLAKRDFILLYYSAHWCGPCRQFTPHLVKFYNTYKAGNTFELIFVSCDRSASEMREYMASAAMPWPAVVFEQRGKLPMHRYSTGNGIPCLVLLDKAGRVVSDSYNHGAYRGPVKVVQDLQQALILPQRLAELRMLVGTPAQQKAIQALIENPTSVDAPRLAAAYTLNGIVAGPQGRRAMINGATFVVGDQLAGLATIVDISTNAVKLKMGSRTFTLSM